MPQDHWLPGFNFNVEEWDAKGLYYETLANCCTSSWPAWRSRPQSRRSPPAGS
jgi:hypothetical protein